MKKYWFVFQTQLLNSLAYPGELLGRALTIVPFMWIFYQLWRVTFAANGGGPINGLTLNMTLWYFALTETIEISRPRVGNNISEAVKDGSIAYLLTKPYHFLLYQYASAMGETLFRALLNILFSGAVVWLLIGPPPAPLGLAWAGLTMLGAWTLHFCIAALIGLAAFAVEDVSAFLWVYQKASFVLGGLLIPLDFYPAWLRNLAQIFPFAALSYAPARLFIEPSLSAFWGVFGQQLAWIAALSLALTLAYRAALRILTINGG